MKIMVEISKEDYESLKKKDKFNDMHLNYYEKLIVNGTPISEDCGKAIIIKPKDVTVGSSLSSIIDTYVKVSEENGLPVHKIVVNDGMVYWDSEETLNKWNDAEEE